MIRSTSPAEIRVSRRVHDVDVVILILKGGVLGADRDSLFPLQVHRIHDPLFRRNRLVGAKSPRLFEQAIHQRGLAMALRLLRIRQVPVGDLLPALLVAPILTGIVAALR